MDSASEAKASAKAAELAFQFSHVFSDMDRIGTTFVIACLIGFGFQFSHVFSDMDRMTRKQFVVSLLVGFNLATSFQTWTEGYISGCCTLSIFA